MNVQELEHTVTLTDEQLRTLYDVLSAGNDSDNDTYT